jgi:hypothetical protein
MCSSAPPSAALDPTDPAKAPAELAREVEMAGPDGETPRSVAFGSRSSTTPPRLFHQIRPADTLAAVNRGNSGRRYRRADRRGRLRAGPDSAQGTDRGRAARPRARSSLAAKNACYQVPCPRGAVPCPTSPRLPPPAGLQERIRRVSTARDRAAGKLETFQLRRAAVDGGKRNGRQVVFGEHGAKMQFRACMQRIAS